MCIMIFLDIWDKKLRQFLVIIPVRLFFPFLFPGSCVQLVNIQRLIVPYRARLHPFLVLKLIGIQLRQDRTVCRTQLHLKSIRIRMLYPPALSRVNAIFIHLSQLCRNRLRYIYTTLVLLIHRNLPPATKFSHDRNASRSRCKYTENKMIPFFMCSKIPVNIKQMTCIEFFLHFSWFPFLLIVYQLRLLYKMQKITVNKAEDYNFLKL